MQKNTNLISQTNTNVFLFQKLCTWLFFKLKRLQFGGFKIKLLLFLIVISFNCQKMGKKEKQNESPHISTTSLFLCAVVAAAKTNKRNLKICATAVQKALQPCTNILRPGNFCLCRPVCYQVHTLLRKMASILMSYFLVILV